MKTTQLLAPLRAKRDRLFNELYDDSSVGDRKVLERGCIGEVDEVRKAFQSEWLSFEHQEFYEVCCKIKQLEAKIYDEAMKGK